MTDTDTKSNNILPMFAAGMTGKTRNGLNYKIVAVLDPADFDPGSCSYPVIANVDGACEEFTSDGRYYARASDEFGYDLMPPKLTVYLNWYGTKGYAYPSEKIAREHGDERSANLLAYPIEIPLA